MSRRVTEKTTPVERSRISETTFELTLHRVTNQKSLSGKGDHSDAKRGEQLMVMNGQIVMENVRRYRAIASLCRQTAALRPLQKWSLLDQAEGWERLAAAELEAYFIVCNSSNGDHELQVTPRADARWELMAAA